MLCRAPASSGGAGRLRRAGSRLGVAHPHNGRGSEALVETKDILMQRGSTPRVYRNMLVFIAADSRQLDNLKGGERFAGTGRDRPRHRAAQLTQATARWQSQAG
jgi:hypothetical protein